MPERPTTLDMMREICLALPDTRETLTWGQPHFRVGDKIFAGCGDERGKYRIGFKLEMDHADAILGDARFERAPYVGHKGWVSMDATDIRDWNAVRPLILESYRLIAPKRSLAKLGEVQHLAPRPVARRKPSPARQPTPASGRSTPRSAARKPAAATRKPAAVSRQRTSTPRRARTVTTTRRVPKKS